MKLAIIGAGISGLVAAYRLHRAHEVTVFEAADYVGGHTHTVDVQDGDERRAIDTGFIVYNDWTYPRFVKLLDELGVATQPTTMSFSVRDDVANLEYNGHSLSTLFAQRRNFFRPGFYRLLADIWRFNRDAAGQLDECPADMTVGQFLDHYRFSRQFSQHYLLPMGAAIWSCPVGDFSRFPVRFIIEFYKNHGLLSITNRPIWRVITGGSRNYVDRLTQGFREQIRLRTPVLRVTRTARQVEIQTARGVELFDHVIFACHSDQALKILGADASEMERGVLGQFPYSRNVAVLHTDISVLPKRRRAWASWNYRVRADRPGSPTVTYNMNILQGIRSDRTFCVTLNEEDAIDPGQVLGRFEYHHPVFTVARAAAQQRHGELIDFNRTSYCGAYWRNGFHEDGVVSAIAVANRLALRVEQQETIRLQTLSCCRGCAGAPA